MIRYFIRTGKFWLGCCVGILGVLAVQVAAAVVDMTYVTISVENGADMAMSDVRIEVSGETIWSGAINPYKTRTASVRLPSDGTVVVQFTRNGERIRYECCYVSGVASDDHFIYFSDKTPPVIIDGTLPPSLQGWFRDGER